MNVKLWVTIVAMGAGYSADALFCHAEIDMDARRGRDQIVKLSVQYIIV